MLTLKELALKIGAEYYGKDMPVPYFSIDTRTLEKGEVFVALRAERDGHEFIASAIEKGAAAVLVEHFDENLSVPQIVAKDTLKAFGQLAHAWRMQFHVPIIGLTGSCGKTTTKEMIASILREKGKTLASQGTFNNAYGVPLTLMQLRSDHEFVVLEMGTNSPGEIAYIAEIAAPTVALITNIGASHLEKLINFAGVSQEKSDIFSHLTESGIAVLNLDEPFMESWMYKIGKRHRLSYSTTQVADVYATNIVCKLDSVSFDLHTPIGIQAVALPLPGNHIAQNAVAAASACLALGIPLEMIAMGLAKMQGVPGRFKQHNLKNGCILIDDSYNASIGAVKNAIETLKNYQGRKIIVLTSLNELGDHAQHFHEEMGQWCNEAHFDNVYFYGKKETLQYALAKCPKAHYFEDKQALIDALGKEVKPNTTILVKGANSFKMYEVLNALLKEDHA